MHMSSLSLLFLVPDPTPFRWNVDFSQVYPSFDLTRVNTLELAMLEALKYVIRVSASEYAKYYFHLRSMAVKLGLSSGLGEPGSFSPCFRPFCAHLLITEPLDIAGARRLQISTEKYEEMQNGNPTTRRRHHSMHDG